MISSRIGLLCMSFVSFASAQETLPAAATIMDRYVSATGGREAYEKLKTEVRTVTLELKVRDVRFTVTTYRAKPNKMYTITEIPGVGKVEEGVDGDVAWSLSEARGAALKQGAERDFALYGARLDAEVNWNEWFPRAEVISTEELEGHTCYKVLLTDKDGEQHSRWYDKEAGFLVKLVLQVKLPQGQFPMEVRFYDYRETGGLLQASRTVRVMPGQEMESRLEKIETNVEIDPARFAMPDAVKALVEKQKAGS